MERKEKLLRGLELSQRVGVEIGPLCRPFVRRADGPVVYVDHATTDQLRAKYRNDPGVDLDELVEVDAVWGCATLREAVGREVDYVVASHVIEHVPDLVTWLGEICDVLREDGQLRLIVPDKRFTFDHARYESRLSDVLYANLVKARIPQAHTVFEYVLNVVKLDGLRAWQEPVDADRLERHHSHELARTVAQEILDQRTYHDAHCWVFTPSSFAGLMAALAEVDKLPLKCLSFDDTAFGTCEFFVHLQRCGDREEIAASWQRMRDALRSNPIPVPAPAAAVVDEEHLAVDLQPEGLPGIVAGSDEPASTEPEGPLSTAPLAEHLVDPHEANAEAEAVSAAAAAATEAAKAAAAAQELDALRAEVVSLHARMHAIEQSNSWRVTAPLRWLMSRVRSR